MWKQLERRAAEGDNRPHSKHRVPWTKEVVTAAHNACIRELLQEVHVHGKAMMMPFNCSDRHMRLLTIETESRLGTLWDQEECNQFCWKEELWEAARDEEMKIPRKGASEGQPPTEEQYQERFWRRRLDGIGLDVVTKEFLAIEFKRTQDMRSNPACGRNTGGGPEAVQKLAAYWRSRKRCYSPILHKGGG